MSKEVEGTEGPWSLDLAWLSNHLQARIVDAKVDITTRILEQSDVTVIEVHKEDGTAMKLLLKYVDVKALQAR